MGTKDGGVHVLSIEVNPEVDDDDNDHNDHNDHNDNNGGGGDGGSGGGVNEETPTDPRGEGTVVSGSLLLHEDASSDRYSSSSCAARSRPSTPAVFCDFTMEQAGEWLVCYHIAVLFFFFYRAFYRALYCIHPAGIGTVCSTLVVPGRIYRFL